MLDAFPVRRGSYKRYHSDLKLFIASGGDIAFLLELGISRTTLDYWKTLDLSKFITHPVLGSPEKDIKLFRKFIKDRR